MKNAHRNFMQGLVMTAGGLLLSFPAHAETTRISFSGHVFTQVSNHPELGDAWMDDTGLIWGDANLNTKILAQKDAIAYCQSIGAELPTKAQFVQLDQLIGDSKQTMDMNGNFLVDSAKVEVIPHLTGLSFWTQDLNPTDPTEVGFVFDYGADAALTGAPNDIINDYVDGGSSLARCVEQK